MLNNYDVAIIGAGWAGLALARQLQRQRSDIRIIQLEASTEFKAKIGEATVENTGHYFLKKLGLANYLYRHQLPKNALRFFFDSPCHRLAIDQLSEHGTTYIPPHPAFQLERATFEAALTQMNRDAGITVLQGAKVSGFTLDHQAGHRVEYQYQGESQTATCQWLIDASGRAGVVTKRMRCHSRENVPQHSSAWGRFDGIKDFDSIGSQQWRDSASSRFLSTNHFTGDGYWIWFIPLKSGQTSIGIVCDKTKVANPPMNEQAFLAKLKEHRAIADLMEHAEIVDFEAWGQLAYRGDGIVNRERWGSTGFASMFLDPLLSGGGDIIAMANDNLTKLILADLAQTDSDIAQQQLDAAVPIANEVVNYYYQFLYAQLMNLYPVIDCAELCSPVMAYINATYFITSAWDYMAGNFEDHQFFAKNGHLRRGNYALEMLMQQQILATLAVLREEDRAFVRNVEGFFETGADLYKYYIYNLGEKGKDGYRIDLRLKLFTECFAIITGSKLGLMKFGRRRLVQTVLNLPMIIAKPTFGRDDLPDLLAAMSKVLTAEVQQMTTIEIEVTITEASFSTETVTVALVDPIYADPACLDSNNGVDTDNQSYADLLVKLQRSANSLWMRQQEYIDQTSYVPMFLRYARQQPEDIMDPRYPVRLEVV